MRIALYTPDLTSEEAERCWMTPVEVCRLAAVGEHADPKVKKMLNTLSDRGHVPFVKSGTARTAPRLYSLVSAAMLRTIFEIVQDGRTYRYAQPVADAIRKTICKAADGFPDLMDFEHEHGEARIVFSGMKDDGTPRRVKWCEGEISGNLDLAYSVFDGGYLIFRILGIYADFWHDDLVKRGEIEPEEAPQIGRDGFPEKGGSDG